MSAVCHEYHVDVVFAQFLFIILTLHCPEAQNCFKILFFVFILDQLEGMKDNENCGPVSRSE